MEGAESESCEIPPYKNGYHAQKAFGVLNDLRKQDLLCDVTLVAEGVEMRAHRVVLASCSPYFNAMFIRDLSESKAEKITIQEIDSTALSLLIDYVYTSEIHVTEDNVQSLLPAANLLQLPDVCNACCDFLQRQLYPTNCVGIRTFADIHSCKDLHACAQNYIMQHFMEVVQGDEFLQLTVDSICELVASDHLTVQSEEKVFEAVVAWVKHDPEVRQEHMSCLMEHVRLPLLSREFLVGTVEEEPLVKANNLCKDFLIEAMKYHLLNNELRAQLRTPRTRPRTPIGLPKLMFVVGGQAPKAIRSVECYDFSEEKWCSIQEMPSRRCRAGIAVISGMIYAVGGFNGSLRVRSVDVFDPSKDVWASVASMEARRSTLGVAVLNGLIYAVGGFDGSTGLSSAEVYNPKTNEWQPTASMSTRRSSVGVAVLGGYVYAVGGYDGSSRQCLSTVERYDPATNEWHLVSEMSTRRSGAGVGVVAGNLYAVGGHDGPLVRKSVEMYSPESNSWTIINEMTLCRRNAGVCAVNSLLYVVGGDDGSSNLSSVEYFNPQTETWNMLPSCMTTGRSYSGIAIIDKPS